MGSDGDVVGFMASRRAFSCYCKRLPLCNTTATAPPPSTTNRTNQTTASISKLQRFSWKNLMGGKKNKDVPILKTQIYLIADLK